TDAELKQLIGKAMAPGQEMLNAFQPGLNEETTTNFKNTVDTVFEYAMTSPSQQEETTKGTLFGAYNAVTGYFQNLKNYRNDEQKLKSILNGSAQRRAQNAFDLCFNFEVN
ncbi:MAG: DUF932 domain-containing protein, partial [Mucilaginibacter polytrichastri]|nr:DUF932 domain-containing protein [Mucilaginibacter polytrichastri]